MSVASITHPSSHPVPREQSSIGDKRPLSMGSATSVATSVAIRIIEQKSPVKTITAREMQQIIEGIEYKKAVAEADGKSRSFWCCIAVMALIFGGAITASVLLRP